MNKDIRQSLIKQAVENLFVSNKLADEDITSVCVRITENRREGTTHANAYATVRRRVWGSASNQQKVDAEPANHQW